MPAIRSCATNYREHKPNKLFADVRDQIYSPVVLKYLPKEPTRQPACQPGGFIIGAYMLPDALLLSRLIFSCVAFLMANAREFLGMASRIVSTYTNMSSSIS